MHRIDGPGATIDHRFTEGNPALSIPATTVTGAWLNAVQEEIAGVIESAGMTLDKDDDGQLAKAVLSLITENAQWRTGDVRLTMRATADDGWVMCDDGAIGPAGSGATSRADDDCEALFKLLWNNVSNSYAPVTGGRGASADADWQAGKTIGLTRMLGRVLGVAGAGQNLTERGLGQAIGAETHTLTVAQMPAHNHSGSAASSGAHTHGLEYYAPSSLSGDTGAWDPIGGGSNKGNATWKTVPSGNTVGATRVVQAGAHTHSITLNNAGGGSPFPLMQPTAFMHAQIKL